MVDTVCATRRLGRHRAAEAGRWTIALGLLVSSAAASAAVAAVGAVLPGGRASSLAVAGICAAAAAGDLLGLRIRPQIALQVPERWRRTMPLPLAMLLYGLLLGTGVSSAIPAFAFWAYVSALALLGRPDVAAVTGLVLGLGRALPILAGLEVGERFVLMRAVRIAAAVAVAAVALGAADAGAAPGIAGAADPSAAGGDLAWQPQEGTGLLRRADGGEQALPGRDPAIGGGVVAWRDGDEVTVADLATLQRRFSERIAGVRQLAVSDGWIVFRIQLPGGAWRIAAQSLRDTSVVAVVAQSRRLVLGRPALSGSLVAYAAAGAGGSSIRTFDLDARRAHTVLRARHELLANPSLSGGRLLYEDVQRCRQALVVARLPAGRARTVYTLPPLAGQDAGHERGHTDQGGRTPCPGRIRPTTRMLWTTALDGDGAFVTVLDGRRPAGTRIVRIPLGSLTGR